MNTLRALQRLLTGIESKLAVKINRYLILFGGYLLYSLAGVVAKSSSGYPLASLQTLARYALVLVILGLYAIVWQISLKKNTLVFAYMSRGSLVVMAMLWSHYAFKEQITWHNIAGVLLVISGIFLFSYQSEPES